MRRVPNKPKIYHITPIENLVSILGDGFIWSDAECTAKGKQHEVVGISEIKQRRLLKLNVKCHPDTYVGEYVPFYFCPRSIMLYLLHKRNHPDIRYQGGQGCILHLEADIKNVVEWAKSNNRLWAFSDRNAGIVYANFWDDLEQLCNLNWDAIVSTDFSDPLMKEGKQAEFLIHGSFPWDLIDRIGIYDIKMAGRVEEIVKKSRHQPVVEVRKQWYY